MTRTAAALAVFLGSALAAAGLAALEVPYLAGRVNDLADMLPADAEERIEARLARLESERGAQVAVLTVPSLDGESLEEYSLRVAETWKLGRESFDDGALLLISRDDRRMRLEVGYGLEPVITDLASGRILDHVLRPRFQQGDFGGGVEQAVEVIAGLIEGDDVLPAPRSDTRRQTPGRGSTLFLLVLGFLSFTALGARGCGGWLLFLVLTPMWFTVPLSLWGSPWGAVPGVLWLIGFPIAWALIGRRAGGASGRRGRSGGSWWSTGSGWSGGGGFSGGGFSGGGGSFGGGGASSSW